MHTIIQICRMRIISLFDSLLHVLIYDWCGLRRRGIDRLNWSSLFHREWNLVLVQLQQVWSLIIKNKHAAVFASCASQSLVHVVVCLARAVVVICKSLACDLDLVRFWIRKIHFNFSDFDCLILLFKTRTRSRPHVLANWNSLWSVFIIGMR